MRVIMVAATTVCGRISPGTMGSRHDREHLENLRAQTDASLLGAATLRQGDPEMRGPGRVLDLARIRAIISASGDIPVENKSLFRFAPRPLIFTSPTGAQRLRPKIGEKAELVELPSPHGRLSLSGVLQALAGRGVRSLLIEGGGQLNYAALSEGIVDEIFLTITPFLSGDHGASLLIGGPQALGNPFLELKLISCERYLTDELYCHYRVIKPEGVNEQAGNSDHVFGGH